MRGLHSVHISFLSFILISSPSLLTRYILVNHGFGLVIKGSSRLNKHSYDLTIFNILYWLLNSMSILNIFLQMPVAKVIDSFKQTGPLLVRDSCLSSVFMA